jgi:hypothetical protein
MYFNLCPDYYNINAQVVLVWQFRTLEHSTKSCLPKHHTITLKLFIPSCNKCTHRDVCEHAPPPHTHTYTHTFLTSEHSATTQVQEWSWNGIFETGSRFFFNYLHVYCISTSITLRKGYTNFPKMQQLSQNPTCLKCDMKQVPHWWHKNIRCHGTKVSCPGELGPRICGHLHYRFTTSVLIYVQVFLKMAIIRISWPEKEVVNVTLA